MFYKPTYCCHCGEKIERVEWSFLSSRRFCEVCQEDFKFHDWLPRVFAGLMTLIGLFGIGMYWQAANKPPQNLTKQLLTSNLNSNAVAANRQNVSVDNVSANLTKSEKVNNLTENSQTARTIEVPKIKTENQPTAVSSGRPTEAVYFCGAETKKGTPCSRRVKGGGRCWQHKGLNAMLPPEKLVISQ
jgi:hypothetical protein